MALDDFSRDRKANAVAVVSPAFVEALKHLEHAVAVLPVDTDTVVLDPEQTLAVGFFGGDADAGRMLAAKLQRIADEILKHLGELALIRAHRRQFFPNDFGVAFVDGDLRPASTFSTTNSVSTNIGTLALVPMRE